MSCISGRCLVADDHPAVTAALVDLLDETGFEVLGPVSDGVEALRAAEEEQPDVALVDYRMPHLGGADLIRGLKEVAPGMRVAVFTGEADEQLVAAALTAGADAVVLKEAPLVDVVRALGWALEGRLYVDPVLASSVTGPKPRAATLLTEREAEVLSLLAEGLTNAEIASQLEISSETVRTHVRKACTRLNTTTRTEAVASALRLGLIG